MHRSGNVRLGGDNASIEAVPTPPRRITVTVTRRTCQKRVHVVANATGVVSHAGSVLLVQLADRLGLSAGLSEAMAGTRERRSAHDPGERERRGGAGGDGAYVRRHTGVVGMQRTQAPPTVRMFPVLP